MSKELNKGLGRLLFFLSYTAILIVAVLGCVFFVWPVALGDIQYSKKQTDPIEEDTHNTRYATTTLLFVGDIMLGRGVESLITEHGFSYPFLQTHELIDSADLAIANFEGTVPVVHTHTPSMTFQFSIREEYFAGLKEVGFDVLSLANNHSYDYGGEALTHTRRLCTQYMMTCIGSPGALDQYSMATITAHEIRIGFIFLHTLFAVQDTEVLREKLESLRNTSDVILAYVHWGDEYVLTHNETQERLAKTLIDHGVDAVIGHHPHVVQDIVLYKGKPIFYSLGNFIFDQYFSRDVQEGLMLKLELANNRGVFTLIPVETHSKRASPAYMSTSSSELIVDRSLSSIQLSESVNNTGRTIVFSYP